MGISKIKNSLAFRLPLFYRLILTGFKFKPAQKTHNSTSEYSIVIICGANQLNMLQVGLKSIYKRFTKLPPVFLFTDLHLNVDECKKAVSWFPDDSITVTGGAVCIDYHRKNQKAALVSFAEKNPMGLKLAAILQVLDNGKPVLYCDTDVIWYNDAYPVIKQYIESDDFELAMSEDFQPAYDALLIEKAGLQTLTELPFFCAGILLVKKLTAQSMGVLERLLTITAQQSNHFSEQTIFAFLNREGNNIVLDKNKFLLKTDDQFEIKPKSLPEVIARHYIGPVRHLFWRDALWMR
jgi:hypothetical protein